MKHVYYVKLTNSLVGDHQVAGDDNEGVLEGSDKLSVRVGQRVVPRSEGGADRGEQRHPELPR